MASRLTRLRAYGIIANERDPEDDHSSVYHLTAKGLDLVPVIMELSNWGTRQKKGSHQAVFLRPGGLILRPFSLSCAGH
ncbi:winged helix-turn-helix transcriptional regulator [Devosia psychrophila]|uniref:winged helix-turn-helix transcriptional regulator n=1 Tax=Devosia psychrophila TaxID=728005 RepID=UPI003D11B2DF